MTENNEDSKALGETIKPENDQDDPNTLEPIHLNQGIEYNGALIPRSLQKDTIGHVKNLIAMEVKEDDVFILAFPKCGTHWIWEVVQMLLNQTTQYEKRTKECAMMEMVGITELESEKSPRVMNSHLFMCHLPKEIVPKKAKIIHLVRNPKDTFVSFYHHRKQISPNALDFGNFMTDYCDNALFMRHQFDFLRQMNQFEKDHPDVPMMHLAYEDMKKNPIQVTKELAEFLGVSASDSFIEEVVAACSFDNMKKVDNAKEKPDVLKEKMKEMKMLNLDLYRKGIIGDWKNHFTVAQNEAFEDFIHKETEKGLNVKFTYE